jgi:hypothetical protein
MLHCRTTPVRMSSSCRDLARGNQCFVDLVVCGRVNSVRGHLESSNSRKRARDPNPVNTKPEMYHVMPSTGHGESRKAMRWSDPKKLDTCALQNKFVLSGKKLRIAGLRQCHICLGYRLLFTISAPAAVESPCPCFQLDYSAQSRLPQQSSAIYVTTSRIARSLRKISLSYHPVAPVPVRSFMRHRRGRC